MLDTQSHMLQGCSLVYFGPEKWDGLWRNRHQLMSVFARKNKVLFVEPRLHLRPTLGRFRQGDLSLADLCRLSVRQISENLFVYRYPVWAPISGRFPISLITRVARYLSIRSVLRRLQMSRPILWFSQPGMVDLVSEIPPASLLIYHVVDEYSAYVGHTPDSSLWAKEREKEMMTQVDVVFVVSRALYEAKRAFNANTYLVPNGVNYQAFTAALADPRLPDELELIKAPRLGYSGLIGDKLNLSMLAELARENPGWSLVFLGEVRLVRQVGIWHTLLAMPNVHYLGAVEASQVPDYLKGLDVGLMPYVQNQHANYISPLKLYDYLAAGLPIASMGIPAAQEFSQHVHLASDPRLFPQAVRSALADTSPERYQARREIAARHTWETRVEQLSGVIEAQLIAKTRNMGADRHPDRE